MKLLLKNVFFFIFLWSLAPSVLTYATSTGTGIFRNSRCIDRLLSIDENYGNNFWSDAVKVRKLGKREEILEYIERRKRAWYLSLQYDKAFIEATFGERLLMEGVLPRVLEGEKNSVKMWKFKAWIVKEGEKWRKDEQAKDVYPLLFESLNSKLPESLEAVNRFRNILELKAGLALRRSYISGQFVHIPMPSELLKVKEEDVIIPEGPELAKARKVHLFGAKLDAEDLLAKAVKKTKFDMLKNLIAFEKDKVENFIPKGIKGKGRKDVVSSEFAHYQKLAQALLDSKEIPQAVKDEINAEIDFNNKYNFTQHIFYHRFLEEVALYFEVETTLVYGK